MDYLIDKVSRSNVEHVVLQLSADWRGNEEWLEKFVQNLNDLNESLRDELRKNKTVWTCHQYKIRLAYHYYNMSKMFNELYKEHELNVQSIIDWLEKCLEQLGEIPVDDGTEAVVKLSADAEKSLASLVELQKALKTERAELETQEGEEYMSLSAKLGDISGNWILLAGLSPETDYPWTRKLQNIIITQMIIFLEESFTHRCDENPLVMLGAVLLSLGYAYATVEIPLSAEQYLNTSQELLKSVSHWSSSMKDMKQHVKAIVAKSVEDGTSLKCVFRTIQEKSKQPLSAIDQAYISRKYGTICFKNYIADIVEFFRDQAKNIADPWMIHEMLACLRTTDSLLNIPHPLDQSVYYDLLKDNYSSFSKGYEHTWMNILKKECATVLTDFINAVKKEVHFFEVFIDFLAAIKDTTCLEDKLNLQLVANQDEPLGKIFSGLLSLDVEEFGEDLREVQAAAAQLKDELLYFEGKFRGFIADYVKPPRIQMVQLDGRRVLEVSGVKIVVSEVIQKNIFKEILNDETCEEIRIIGGNAVHVDSSFNDMTWRGKNIVVLTKRMFVHGKVVWDVSGRDGALVYSSDAGQDSDGKGNQGKDGEAGESGGNVLVLVDAILDPKNLTIISFGGNGSNGQDGGDGRDGQDGRGITKNELESKFPPAANVFDFLKFSQCRNIKTALKSIRECGTIIYTWYERSFLSGVPVFENYLQIIIDDLDEEKNGNIFIQAVTHEGNELEFCFCQQDEGNTFSQSYFLFKGAPGMPGSKGGIPGMGGQGGFRGEVILRNPNDLTTSFDVAVKTRPGSDGKSGKGGKCGNHGKNGWDMGYLDYGLSTWVWSEWPKWYGVDRKSKVELRHHKFSSSENVWSPYRRYKKLPCLYVGMKASDQQNYISQQFNERATLPQNQERTLNAKATSKKTISQANLLSQYQHMVEYSEKASLTSWVNQINKANEELLQSIVLITTSKFEVNSTARFTANAAYKKAKSKECQDLPEPKLERQSESDVKPKLIKNLQIKPMQLVAWRALGTIRLTKEETVELAAVFDSLFAAPETSETQPIRKMFLEKYRFVMLNEISKRLPDNDGTVFPENVDPIEVMKYLRVEEEDASAVSHLDAGALNQFLYVNKKEEREKIVQHITTVLNNFENELLHVFRAFILTLRDSSSSSHELKSRYNKYNEFLAMEKRGFIVFPESLERIDRESLGKTEIVEDIKQYIRNEGCLTSPCIQLLSHIFNKNLRVYKESNIPNEPFYLENNYNPSPRLVGSNLTSDREHAVHVLIRSEKCIQMQIDWDHMKMDKKRELLATRCRKILRETKALDSRESMEIYLANREFLSESRYDAFSDDDSASCSSEADTEIALLLEDILETFDDKEDKILFRPRLSKIASYVSVGIVESIHRRFTFEGRHVSAQELCCLINAVLKSAAEGNPHWLLYQWIIMGYPQDQWVDQVLLMDLETFFKKSLPSKLKQKWEEYMLRIKRKPILMQLRERLNTSQNDSGVEKCVEDILYMLSEIQSDFQPGELGLAEWPYALKEKYWSQKLMEIIENKDPLKLSVLSYYLLSIENNQGDDIVKEFMEMIKIRRTQLTPELLTTILCSLHDGSWDLSGKQLAELEVSTDLRSWVSSMTETFHADGEERNLDRLCQLLESNANNSEGAKSLLMEISCNLYYLTTHLDFPEEDWLQEMAIRSTTAEERYLGVITIRSYDDSEIGQWLKVFSAALKVAKNDINNVGSNVGDIFIEMLEVVDRAIYLKRGIRLRNTQKLAVMILLKNKNSTLAQVATGEGKSLIVVTVSIIKALIGGKVDVITSSSILAKRDAETYNDIYRLFGIDVSHNCSKDIEVRKATYSANQVVYGDLSDFQRDYLLHEFYNINILGDRKFETVVVDEVDCMLLDKGNNTLYLSHDIPGLDKLESLFLFIWRWVSHPCGDRESVLFSMNAKKLRDAVFYDIYGTIKIEDIKALDVTTSNQQARTIWKNMKTYNVIDELSRLKIDSLDRKIIGKVLSPDWERYIDPLCYLINECIYRDRQIRVPNCFKPFIDLHLDKWIDNAIHAFYMKSGEDYVVDVDRTGTSPDRNPNVIIIDKDTGTDQSNSQWDQALHQFLQLKHGCKVTTLSLKAVFISNVSYFKQYARLNGLTGTLGSQGERELLKEVHNVDFVTIPTAKPKQFREYAPKVCCSDTEWKTIVKTTALDFVNKDSRSVLIICQSINDVEDLHQVFGNESASSVHTYARDYEEFDVTQSEKELGPGHIIIATNLAGRGTDIKISDELKQAGGLHVIIAYLPKNTRIEQQAFGRAARCGEKGSGQLIIRIADKKETKILNLKHKRDSDELERITEIKSFYNNHIKVEEMCFRKFKEQLIELKNSVARMESFNAKGEDFILRSCINKWAYWLDHNGKFIKDWANAASKNSLNSSLDKFLLQMKNLRIENHHDWSEWVDGNPISTVELAKHFLENKEYEAAVYFLDKVIRSEPDFAEAAHYYKAAALGCVIDWESKPPETDSNVEIMKQELSIAETLFERIGSTAMTNAAIIGAIKHDNQQSLIRVGAYEEQQKNIANICRFFSESIRNISGHFVTPETFIGWNIDSRQANTLYQLLIQRRILTPPKVTLKNMTDADLEAVSCEYDIPIALLKDFLSKHEGKEITSFNQFRVDLKKSIRLPSKEEFWKELVKMKFFSKEVKYVIVKLEMLAEVDPSLRDTLIGDGCNADLKRHDLEQGQNQIFLNSEQLIEQMKDAYVFEKEAFKKRVGSNRFASLKEKGVLAFNRQCDFDADSLITAAASQPNILTMGDLIRITDEAESEIIIQSLCDDNVIMRMDSPEEFRVIANSDAIDKLSFDDDVKCLLKKRGQLSHYDSIEVSDLTRNRVSQGDALTILQELEVIKVIKKIPNTNSYRLATHYTDLDLIHLNMPVYKNVTKSVMNMCFMYRIALQKIGSYIENGCPPKLHLKTKPHMGLFWSLLDSKVICLSQVNVDGAGELVSKKNVEKATSTLNETELENMFINSLGLPDHEVKDLISNLVSNEWLSLESSEYKVERGKEKRKPLNEDYSNYQKTVTILLNQLVDLSDDSTIASITQCLDQMKSFFALDVPSFGLKPLSGAFPEGDFSMIQELRGFLLYGLGELIVVGEKAYTNKFWWRVGVVVFLGVLQIAIGAFINIHAVGWGTHFGRAFINEGISDIMFAIGAATTGYFRWEDFFRHKIESVALTAVTAGFGAIYSRGSKFSKVGQKMNPTGLNFLGRKLTEVSGAKILRKQNASIAMAVVRTVGSKTLEAVAFGSANYLIDKAINNSLLNLGESIASKISQGIDQEIQNHRITKSLECAFRMKGGRSAKQMVVELTDHFFANTNIWKEMSSWATKFLSCILRGFAEGVAKRQSAGKATRLEVNLLRVLEYVVEGVNYVKYYMDIKNMTRRMLDGLAEDIDRKLEGDQSVEQRHPGESGDNELAQFKADILDRWRDEIGKRSGDIVGQHIIGPLMKHGAHKLLRYAGRQAKAFYKEFKEERYYQDLLSRKKQYQDEIGSVESDAEATERITKEYWEGLLKLARKTRNPKVYADIIREEVPMDITCLHVFEQILPEILRTQGINDGFNIQVEKGDMNQEFGKLGISGETIVIRLKIHDNHYQLLDEDGESVPLPLDANGKPNNCLIRAISHKIDLGMSEGEFRNLIADSIERNSDIRNIIQRGYHSYGISVGLYGGEARKPYESDSYKFKSETDIDLSKYGKHLVIEQIYECLQKPIGSDDKKMEIRRLLKKAGQRNDKSKDINELLQMTGPAVGKIRGEKNDNVDNIYSQIHGLLREPGQRDDSYEETYELLQKAFTDTLEKINCVLTGEKVEGWKGFKLVSPGDEILLGQFEPTMYDLIYAKNTERGKAYYPVEMETIVKLKYRNQEEEYSVRINMDTCTFRENQKKGKQGKAESEDTKGPRYPHLGYEIELISKPKKPHVFPKRVVGHCILPRLWIENFPSRYGDGVRYVEGRAYPGMPIDKQPSKYYPRIPFIRIINGPVNPNISTYKVGQKKIRPRRMSFPSVDY